jgi:seryl-tRNA synthetase
MLDINFIRENQDTVSEAIKKRKSSINLDEVLVFDKEKRELINESETLRQERNKLASEGVRDETAINNGKEIKKKLSEVEVKLKAISEKLENLLLLIPNIPDKEVPEGESEADNKTIKEWGSPTKFDFEPKDHLELGKDMDIVDMERGAKVSGSGFYYLKNEGALLEMALINFAISKLRQKGFNFLIVPNFVREKAMIGTGFFPTDESEVYKASQDDLFLAGTSEVGLVSYHSDEVLDIEKLPLKYAGFSSCFRREAGAHGKDTKGLFRVHQFNKVEMVVFSKPNDSEMIHQDLLAISEEILKELELPYQVVINCLGDLGLPNKKRYDINTWMPSWENYRETHSASNDGDFQTRRLNIKYREAGKLKFCHTLNNTAIASPRLLIALLENHQQEDGSIVIPKALHPFIDFERIESSYAKEKKERK